MLKTGRFSTFLKNLFVPKFALDPIHPAVNFLNGLVSICFLYNMILISYSSVFFWTFDEARLTFQILNIMADVVYFIDFTVARMFMYVEKDTGNIIVDPKKCQWNYFCSAQFKIDIFANLPLEWLLGSFFVGEKYGIKPEFWCYTRLNRLVKISTFFRFAEYLQTNTSWTTFWRIGLTTFYLVVFVHMDACVYYKISKLQDHNTTWGLNQTIKYQLEFINGTHVGYRVFFLEMSYFGVKTVTRKHFWVKKCNFSSFWV